MKTLIKILKFREHNKTFILHNLIIILFFTYFYKQAAKYYGTKMEKKNFKTMEDCFYFTIITHFGVGFGDIVPESKIMKRLCMLQIILVFLVLLY